MQRKVDERVPEERGAQSATRLAPFMLLHTLSLEVVDADATDAKLRMDKWNSSCATMPIAAKGTHICAELENSPARRKQLQTCDSNTSRPPSTWTTTRRPRRRDHDMMKKRRREK